MTFLPTKTLLLGTLSGWLIPSSVMGANLGLASIGATQPIMITSLTLATTRLGLMPTTTLLIYTLLHDSDNKVKVGIFIWSGDFINLDRLLKCIHKSYVSPASIPGASWDNLHIGLKVKTFPELEAPHLDPKKINPYNSSLVCPHCPIAVYTHSPHSEHTCNMLIRIFNRVPNFLYCSGCYDISLLPHAKFMRSGHSATAADLASSPKENRCK